MSFSSTLLAPYIFRFFFYRNRPQKYTSFDDLKFKVVRPVLSHHLWTFRSFGCVNRFPLAFVLIASSFCDKNANGIDINININRHIYIFNIDSIFWMRLLFESTLNRSGLWTLECICLKLNFKCRRRYFSFFPLSGVLMFSPELIRLSQWMCTNFQ